MKRPLVFIHGWGFDERIWDEFIDEYFTEFEVEKINLFEYFEDNLNTNDLLETVCSKLITSIKQNAVIIAWSLGALVATRLSNKLNQNNHRLCLLNFNPCFINKADWNYGVDEEMLVKMIADVQTNHVLTLNRFYKLITVGTSNQKNSLRMIKQKRFCEQLTKEKLVSGLKLLMEIDLRNELENIQAPSMLLYSENDKLVNHKIYFEKPFNNNNIDYVTISEADHIPFMSKPAETAKEIKRFLDDHG